jgi:surface antigen
MTNLHTDVIETARTRRRRQLTRLLAAGALGAGAAVSIAVPAQAADVTGYHVSGTNGAGARVVSDPRVARPATVGTLTDGTAITIDCGVRVNRDTVWHHITSPVAGFVSARYTDIPRHQRGRLLRGEQTCPTTKPAPTPPAPTTPAPSTPAPSTPAPATPAPVATRGATITYNQGYAGSCVFYALDRFKKFTGVYPKAFGDAKYLASSAASNGWSVGNVPRVNSMAVFQSGQNGAGAQYGHVAWVEQVSGDRIYVAEMNFPNAYTVTYRWLTPVAGVQYVYAV